VSNDSKLEIQDSVLPKLLIIEGQNSFSIGGFLF